MSALSVLLGLAIAAPCAAGAKLSGAVESVPRHAVTGAGGLFASAGYSLNAAAAEAGGSSMTGTGYRLHAGLMNLVAQPGSVTSITALSKSTGTLALSWNSPGLDGFLGSVSGFYRIDASSDPLHVFDPTVFLTEFATNTVPGNPQTYLLSGLLPNTTYFAKIYLSDARKVVSETSVKSGDSTLARAPDPVFTEVHATSATLSWTLPVEGAEGWRTDASSTNFGALFPGGIVTTSATAQGLVVSLTLPGLTANTTYFFKLASLNWQSDLNYSAIIATRTRLGGPLPVLNLALSANNLGRTVALTWTNPAFADPAGVTILVSTNPITAGPSAGTSYPVGFTFADGSVVKAAAADASHLESGLELDVTSYFSIYSKDALNLYSTAVSTLIVLDLPPMMPAALWSEASVDKSSLTIHWWTVSSNSDGTPFKAPSAPGGWELDRYEVYRATSVARAGWTLIGSTPSWAESFTAAVPDPSRVYYYKIASRDAFAGGWADEGMVADTSGNVWALGSDSVTRMKIPAELTYLLRPAGNSYGAPLMVRATERPQDLGGKIFRSVSFDAFQSPSGKSASVALPGPAEVVLRYEVSGGQVVPSGLAAAGKAGARTMDAPVPAADAAQNLAAYLTNGADAFKLFGNVDTFLQTLQIQSAQLGNYQIRSVLRGIGFEFDVSGISNKALTPNGDGLNDTVVMVFDNPKDSAFSGKVFDRRGAWVADMRVGPLSRNSLLWDGRSASGSVVPGGVYLYRIISEGRTFSGSLVVVR